MNIGQDLILYLWDSSESSSYLHKGNQLYGKRNNSNKMGGSLTYFNTSDCDCKPQTSECMAATPLEWAAMLVLLHF